MAISYRQCPPTGGDADLFHNRVTRLGESPVGAGPLYRTEQPSTGTHCIFETPRLPQCRSSQCVLAAVVIARMARSYRWKCNSVS